MTHYVPLQLPVVKVCGITRESDVHSLATAGVNAMGLNFVELSPRFVDFPTANKLLQLAAELKLSRVAVVMNPEVAELTHLLSELRFDYLQLHGTEVPELIDGFDWSQVHAPLGIIKAVSWSGRGEERELAHKWQQWKPAKPGPSLAAFLIDAYAPLQGGGTGRVARWDLLSPLPTELQGVSLILAGGLKPDNTAAAIAAVRPDGVDTASGVEDAPGSKNRMLVDRFASASAHAFAQLLE